MLHQRKLAGKISAEVEFKYESSVIKNFTFIRSSRLLLKAERTPDGGAIPAGGKRQDLSLRGAWRHKRQLEIGQLQIQQLAVIEG